MNKKYIIILTIATLAITGFCLLKHYYMMEQDYYVSTPDGYYPVNNRVKNYGYKVIGDCKIWNPHPFRLSDSDIIFIKGKLPLWLNSIAKVNPPIDDNKLDNIPNNVWQKEIKYAFTYFGPGLTETDTYLLSISVENNTRSINIYIPKAFEGIVYPFKDEEWNKNISYNDK